MFKTSTARTHSKKLIALGIDASPEPCNPDSIIHNFSSITFQPRLKTLLAFGLDFCLPVYKLNFVNYFLCFEKIVSITNVLQCENKSGFMRELKHTAHKFYYNFKSYKIFSSVIKPRDISILKAFSKNSNIMVCKPDKGRGVVVVDKVNYLESMNSIISDNLRFPKL